MRYLMPHAAMTLALMLSQAMRCYVVVRCSGMHSQQHKMVDESCTVFKFVTKTKKKNGLVAML